MHRTSCARDPHVPHLQVAHPADIQPVPAVARDLRAPGRPVRAPLDHRIPVARRAPVVAADVHLLRVHPRVHVQHRPPAQRIPAQHLADVPQRILRRQPRVRTAPHRRAVHIPRRASIVHVVRRHPARQPHPLLVPVPHVAVALAHHTPVAARRRQPRHVPHVHPARRRQPALHRHPRRPKVRRVLDPHLRSALQPAARPVQRVAHPAQAPALVVRQRLQPRVRPALRPLHVVPVAPHVDPPAVRRGLVRPRHHRIAQVDAHRLHRVRHPRSAHRVVPPHHALRMEVIPPLCRQVRRRRRAVPLPVVQLLVVRQLRDVRAAQRRRPRQVEHVVIPVDVTRVVVIRLSRRLPDHAAPDRQPDVHTRPVPVLPQHPVPPRRRVAIGIQSEVRVPRRHAAVHRAVVKVAQIEPVPVVCAGHPLEAQVVVLNVHASGRDQLRVHRTSCARDPHVAHLQVAHSADIQPVPAAARDLRAPGRAVRAPLNHQISAGGRTRIVGPQCDLVGVDAGVHVDAILAHQIVGCNDLAHRAQRRTGRKPRVPAVPHRGAIHITRRARVVHVELPRHRIVGILGIGVELVLLIIGEPVTVRVIQGVVYAGIEAVVFLPRRDDTVAIRIVGRGDLGAARRAIPDDDLLQRPIRAHAQAQVAGGRNRFIGRAHRVGVGGEQAAVSIHAHNPSRRVAHERDEAPAACCPITAGQRVAGPVVAAASPGPVLEVHVAVWIDVDAELTVGRLLDQRSRVVGGGLHPEGHGQIAGHAQAGPVRHDHGVARACEIGEAPEAGVRLDHATKHRRVVSTSGAVHDLVGSARPDIGLIEAIIDGTLSRPAVRGVGIRAVLILLEIRVAIAVCIRAAVGHRGIQPVVRLPRRGHAIAIRVVLRGDLGGRPDAVGKDDLLKRPVGTHAQGQGIRGRDRLIGNARGEDIRPEVAAVAVDPRDVRGCIPDKGHMDPPVRDPLPVG